MTYLNRVAESIPAGPGKRRLAIRFRKCFGSSTAPLARQRGIPWRWRFGRAGAGLTPNCVLIRRDGVEAAIEDSAAPIHDRWGRVTGAVMVFHDVSTSRAMSHKMAYLAQHDILTDLPNRVLFSDRLSQAMGGAPSPERTGGAVPGHGPVQAHQRLAGPRDRRQLAAIRGAAVGRLRAQLGYCQPARRR